MDLALVLPVFIVVQYIRQTFGSDLLRWVHLQGFYLSLGPLIQYPAALTTIQGIAGVVAGILEEIVVLGFLVRRLEQLGLAPHG
jgi:membrane protease YdiL (CAAX protease family)